MLRMVKVQEAAPGGPTTLLGRPSTTRAAWEDVRESDAADLNRLQEAGGEVKAYVAPLWSNADAARGLQELRGFDEARVYVVPAPGDDVDLALAAVAESDWAGVALFRSSLLLSGGEGTEDEGSGSHSLGEDGEFAARLHAAVGLEIPLLLPDLDPSLALRVVALTLGEDLSPREIEAVVRGEDAREPDGESRDWAAELLGGDAL